MARTKKEKQNTAQEPETAEKAAEGTAQEPEMAEEGEVTHEPETAEEGEAEAKEPETAKDTEAAEEKRDLLAGLPNPCVYCGPSIKGVARQYTIYQGGGLPEALRAFVEDHPEVLPLIVSIGKFPAMRKRLDTPGTPEARLFKRIKGEL